MGAELDLLGVAFGFAVFLCATFAWSLRGEDDDDGLEEWIRTGEGTQPSPDA